ncbi:MAG: hypothetical protein M1429_03685 [Patescibacteria group bacterium]|nr:hypothetical protein [Patescibacteria group bacterium]
MEAAVNKRQKIGDVIVDYLFCEPDIQVPPKAYMKQIIEQDIVHTLGVGISDIIRIQAMANSQEELVSLYDILNDKGLTGLTGDKPDDIYKKAEVMIAKVWMKDGSVCKVAVLHDKLLGKISLNLSSTACQMPIGDKELDSVCGKSVNRDDAIIHDDDGVLYYFCSQEDKDKFLRNGFIQLDS